MNNEYFYFWPPMQLPCFIVGFWTWHLAKDYLIGAKVLPLRACRWLVAGGLVMVAALFLAGTGRGMAHGVAPTFAAAATAALMLVLTRIASRTLQAPALVMLGRYSFGIYVWHFIAILGVRAVVRIGAVDDFAEYHACWFLPCRWRWRPSWLMQAHGLPHGGLKNRVHAGHGNG